MLPLTRFIFCFLLQLIFPFYTFALDSCVVPNGSTYTINEFGTCQRVTNNDPSGHSIMVPTKTSPEWSTGGNSFLTATPANVVIASCAVCGDTASCAPSSGDGTPDAYSFTDLINQSLSTAVTSDIIQITGITCASPVTLTGAASRQFRICDDATCSSAPAFGTTGSISNNQYLQLKVTTSALSNTAVTVTPNIGGITDIWRATTCSGAAANAYSFTNLTNQSPSTSVTSNIVQITGITCATAVTLTGTASRQFRVCSDATCSTDPAFGTAGTINPNEYLQLKLTTSPGYSAELTVTPNIGGTTTVWRATTQCDNLPNAYTFQNIASQSVSTSVSSNIVQLTGMAAACPATVTISGDASAQFRVCSDATCSTAPAYGTTGSISNNQYLQLRVTTSAANSTVTTATPIVTANPSASSVSTNWNAATIGVGCDTTPTVYTNAGTQAYTVPANCSSIMVESFGGGGGGANSAIGGGGGGGGGGSLLIRDSDSKVISAAGGGGGGVRTAAGGGGGGYSKCSFITIGSGQNFTAYIGGGGSTTTDDSGGNGGAVSGGTAGTSSTYGGGGGGVGESNDRGGNGGGSTYGGGGGAGNGGFGGSGTDNGVGGNSTYGGVGAGTVAAEGGNGYIDSTCTATVITAGSDGTVATGGAAANSGPGNGGNADAVGIKGKVIITPAP